MQNKTEPTAEEGPERLRRAVETYLRWISDPEPPPPETFLAEHPDLREMLEGLMLDEAEAAELELPERLGDYEPVREVGRGGMGVVLEARQVSLDRTVALKLLPSSRSWSPQAVVRFRSEARTAASLRHPNLVDVYEVGEESGQHYYSMEFIDGVPLSKVFVQWESGRSRHSSTAELATWVDKVTDPPEGLTEAAKASPANWREEPDLVRFLVRGLAEIAEGLEYTHRQGVLHRDVKPANILLDRRGRFHLTDFGLASLELHPALSATGDWAGTPYYSAPERVSGAGTPVDRRCDVYSLGVTLYELLTGRLPFDGSDRGEVLLSILTREAPDPRKLDPTIPEDLAAITLHALEKDPEQRYTTAAAFAEDLRRWLEGRAVSVRPIGSLKRLQRWAIREPRRAALVLLSAVSVLTAASVGGYLAARMPAIDRGLMEQGAQRVREAVTEGQLELEFGSPALALAAYDRALAIDGDDVHAIIGKGTALLRLDLQRESIDHLSAQFERTGVRAIERSRANLLAKGGYAEESQRILDRLGPPTERAERFVVAQQQLNAGEVGDRKALEESLAILRDLVLSAENPQPLHHFRLALAAGTAADENLVRSTVHGIEELWPDSIAGTFFSALAFRKVDRAEARQRFERILESRPDFAKAHSELAWICQAEGDLEGAIGHLRRDLELDPDHTNGWVTLAGFLLRLKRHEEALAACDEAIARRPDRADARLNRASALRQLGRNSEALAAFDAALERDANLIDAVFGRALTLMTLERTDEAVAALAAVTERTPRTARLHHQRGNWLSSLDRVDEAESAFEAAVQSDPRNANAQIDFGAFYLRQQRYRDAVARLEAGVELAPEFSIGHVNLASAHFRLEDYSEAASSFRRASETRPVLYQSFMGLGGSLLMTEDGDLEEAISAYERALELRPNLATLHGSLGEALRRRGEGEKALAALEQCFSLDPAVADAHRSRCDLFRDEPGLGSEKSAAESWAQHCPEEPAAWHRLGEALLSAGSTAELSRAVECAVKAKANETEPSLESELLHARALLAQGEPTHRNLDELWPRLNELPESPRKQILLERWSSLEVSAPASAEGTQQ